VEGAGSDVAGLDARGHGASDDRPGRLTVARKRSIHIGINEVDPAEYHDNRPAALAGCENDALALVALAKQAGFRPRSLLGADATSERIVEVLREHADLLEDGDHLLVTYAGHGGYVLDVGGDESDSQDETWVLYDRQFLDDEIKAELARFRPGVRILVLSDSCHSGSVIRDVLPADAGAAEPPRLRTMPDVLCRADSASRAETYARAKAEVAGVPEPPAAVVLMAACQDDEEAQEIDGHGVFTSAVVDVWAGGSFTGDHRELCKAVAARVDGQVPNLLRMGGDVDPYLRERPFLGGPPG
jgi:hypothetical protein